MPIRIILIFKIIDIKYKYVHKKSNKLVFNDHYQTCLNAYGENLLM